MDEIKLGNVSITRLEEMHGPVGMTSAQFFPGLAEADWERHEAMLVPDHAGPAGGLPQFAMLTWLLRSEGRTILVDTGVGNDKSRPAVEVWDHLQLDSLGAVDRYLDIPYAAAPAGRSRFLAPRPHDPWAGTRDGTRPGPTAPQPERGMFGRLDMSPYFGPGWVQGEDYLTVNVWAPSDGAGGLPVVVFVHGGGFVAGSTRAAMYDGSAFARDGVVCVTVNYRLGIPGFLDLPGAPPNRGLLDVLAAVGWVRENAVAFGGDPANITVIGQSAGAMLVGAFLAAPAAQGAVRRAVMQSGSGCSAFLPEQAARVTRAASHALDVTPDLDGFTEVPDNRLVAIMPALAGLDLATAQHPDPMQGISAFSVVLEQQPAHAVADGAAAGVDLLIGSNSEEGNLYVLPQGRVDGATRADVLAAAAAAHPRFAELVAAYRAQRPSASEGELLSAILGDALFVVGSRRMALAHTGRADAKARTYAYRFGWRSGALGGRLGSCHVAELPFTFDVTELPALRGSDRLLGPDAPPAALARRTHAAWVSFARTGDPGWEPYEPDRRRTMHIGDEWLVADHTPGPEERVWG